MAELLKFAKPGDEPAEPDRTGFVETDSARSILRSLNLARAMGPGALTMIAGAPGTGKTTTIRQFVATTCPDAALVTAYALEGTPRNFALHLAEAAGLWVKKTNALIDVRQCLGLELARRGMLIVDEAQYLIARNPKGRDGWEVPEWLRIMAEDWGFALVFVGGLALVEAESAAPQLWSRLRRRVILSSLSRPDVENFVRHRGFDDPSVVDSLAMVARRNAALRDVDNVLTHAALFSGGEQVDPVHIMAAIEDLHLGPKGGR